MSGFTFEQQKARHAKIQARRKAEVERSRKIIKALKEKRALQQKDNQIAELRRYIRGDFNEGPKPGWVQRLLESDPGDPGSGPGWVQRLLKI